MHFQDFPSKQTLDNSYRGLLNIWREAYSELIDPGLLKSKLDPNEVDFKPSELAPLDAGTRKRIELLLALFRETLNRCNNQALLIRKSIPLTEGGVERLSKRPEIPPDLVAELRSWIGRLDNGTSELDLDQLGVRVSRRCKPGNFVMSLRLLEALRAIAANE